MDTSRARELAGLYRTELMENVVPYWERYSPDTEHGGFFTCLDRQWQLYDSGKWSWFQGRAVWMLSRLYRTADRRPAWLEAAQRGIEFIDRHLFDPQGRMYSAVTRDGTPRWAPKSLFSECFTVYGLAQYARAAQDAGALDGAQRLFSRVLEMAEQPELDGPRLPGQPPFVIHAVPMILLNLAQEMREATGSNEYDKVADEMLYRILRLHCHPEHSAVFENVLPDGEVVDDPDGRVLNPGHAMESAWFILREAQYRNDNELRDRAVQMIDWSLDAGWDSEYGGMFYFVDARDRPNRYLQWDMKLWWVHMETLYALLLGHSMTGRADLLAWFERIHEWTWARFPDQQHGGWYGYLRRDGEVCLTLKGSAWKGFYHVPRALLLIAELLEELAR